tara:strand:- start:698 stop:868 length:171 start_codon:yes stop_codon:yes gene_type:complete
VLLVLIAVVVHAQNWREMTILCHFTGAFCPKIFVNVKNVVIWGAVPRHDELFGPAL